VKELPGLLQRYKDANALSSLQPILKILLRDRLRKPEQQGEFVEQTLRIIDNNLVPDFKKLLKAVDFEIGHNAIVARHGKIYSKSLRDLKEKVIQSVVPPAHSDYPVTFRCFVGRNPRTLKVRFQIEDYSRYDDPILICGEYGVGKGVVANTIYKIINRNRGYEAGFRFRDFRNIQPEFIKNELLDCRNFEDIPGGILFLHNIGYVSDTDQKELLKWLGRWDYDREKMDIRVIAFTHSSLEGDLENFIHDNKLRIKLIKVPSLRERISDLERLMYNLRQNIKSETGVTIRPTSAVVTYLKQYSWPLNLWELQRIMKGIAENHAKGEVVNFDVDNLPPEVRDCVSITPAQELVRTLETGAIDFLEGEIISQNQDAWEQAQGDLDEFIRSIGIRFDSPLLKVYELLKSEQYNEALTKLDNLKGESLHPPIAEDVLRLYANAGLRNENEVDRLVGKLENITDSIGRIKNLSKLICSDSSVSPEYKKEIKEELDRELVPMIVD
jgi:DNA-binding NtrC family response regulator